MRLEDVRRGTKASAVHGALQAADACREALEWIEDIIDRKPNTTAQGLWKACPEFEWMSWLVYKLDPCKRRGIGLMHQMDYAAYDYMAQSYKVTADTMCEDDCKLAAKYIYRTYESPWLP